MKILITILQVILALWNIIGGVYVMNNHADLASPWAASALPAVFWIVLGVAQIILSIGLLVSLGNSARRRFATPSAIALAIISLMGLVLYSAYTGFPGMLWALIPAGLLVLVAYKRKA